MRTLLCGAAALALSTLPAAAQDAPKTTTLDPIDLSTQAKKPPPKLSDKQIAAIRDGLVAVHTQQKAPPGFNPEAGAALPGSVKLDALPQDLVRQDPAFRELGYAKTGADIVVVDPLTKTVVAVIPRKFAADPNAKPPTPASWAEKHGPGLTGQGTADDDGASAAPHQPAGDSGDVPNGDVDQAKEKK